MVVCDWQHTQEYSQKVLQKPGLLQAEEEQDAGSAEPGATELETAEMDADSEAEEARQQERRASHAQAGSKDAQATAEGIVAGLVAT